MENQGVELQETGGWEEGYPAAVMLGPLSGALPPLQLTSSSGAGQVLSLTVADVTSKQAMLRVTVQ